MKKVSLRPMNKIPKRDCYVNVWYTCKGKFIPYPLVGKYEDGLGINVHHMGGTESSLLYLIPVGYLPIPEVSDEVQKKTS